MTDDRVFAKCAWRLIPLMGLLYAINLIDRINVGFAALTMNADLGFSPIVFRWTELRISTAGAGCSSSKACPPACSPSSC
jgi:hypothetical protein